MKYLHSWHIKTTAGTMISLSLEGEYRIFLFETLGHQFNAHSPLYWPCLDSKTDHESLSA